MTWKRSDHGAMLAGPSFTFYVQRRTRRGFGLQERGTKTYYVLVRTPTGGVVGGYHTQEMGVEYPSVAEAKKAAETWIETGKLRNPMASAASRACMMLLKLRCPLKTGSRP